MADTIWRRRGLLDKERREFMRDAMREFDEQHNKKLRALMDECGASETGHNWRFTHLGPLSDPWFACSVCGKTKVELESGNG